MLGWVVRLLLQLMSGGLAHAWLVPLYNFTALCLAGLKCLAGVEECGGGSGMCKTPAWLVCVFAGNEVGGLRLVGGRGDGGTRGRLEVCYQRQWGAVCAKNFGAEDAQVRAKGGGLQGCFRGSSLGSGLPGGGLVVPFGAHGWGCGCACCQRAVARLHSC